MEYTDLNIIAPRRAVRLSRVCHLTGASRATIWRWVKSNPEFPRPFHMSAGITCWDESELVAWIEVKKAQRGAA